MVTKKDLFIAVLATFCLTVLIFLTMPIKSANSPYDPWLDYNEDGKISLSDLVTLAQSYGATGDPTKNVNVTNWPIQQPYPAYKVDTYMGLNISWTNNAYYSSFRIEGNTTGFSRLVVQITVYGWSMETSSANVSCNTLLWLIDEPTGLYSKQPSPISFNTISFFMGETFAAESFVGLSAPVEVGGPIYILNPTVFSPSQSGWVLMNVYVYLRNE